MAHESQMYPFMYLMPDESLYIFTDIYSELFNAAENRTLRELPPMPGMHRTYPNTGGSVMLPLGRDGNYVPEIMICGGGAFQGIDSPCENTCGRIKPMNPDPHWEMASMGQPRGMVEGVLLLDGTVLWINGCRLGAQGFGIAKDPALDARVYDPKSYTWTTDGRSEIARLYHSVALLLLDGSVLVAGSNPSWDAIRMEDVDVNNQYMSFPTEFRIEIWTPPYLRGEKISQRPTNIVLSTLQFDTNTHIIVRFELAADLDTLEVILHSNGFVTHSVHMGQVMVYLEKEAVRVLVGGRYELDVHLSDQVTVAPGPYVVYVVANGVPGIGQFVSFRV
jgi:hypothetical protein